MKKKAVINADQAMGVSAMVISLLTLFIFLYQTSLLRDQSRLSVRPRLSFSKIVNRAVTLDEADSINATVINLSLTLRNDGLGPAIIESNRIIDKDKAYDISDFFDTVYPKLKEYGLFTQLTELRVGEAIPVSKTIDIFTYQYDLIHQDKISSYLGISEPYALPFEVLVEYSSLYEEKWRIESDAEDHPKRID